MKIEANEKKQQFLSISLHINVRDTKYKLKSLLCIPLDDRKEPPHIFILKDISICYIQYDEIDLPLNYSIINDDDNEVHTPYLKNWNDKV